MSEADERQALSQAFLRIVHEIDMSQSGRTVTLDQVAEYLDPETLGITGPDYVTKLSNVGKYLSQLGWVEAKGESKTSGPTMFTITREGINELEGRNQPQQPNVTNNTFNVGGSLYNTVIGNDNTANFSGQFDFSTVYEQIETEAEEADKEELRQLLAEVRDLLESGQTLNKGFLARWNDKLQKYSWLANAVAGWLLNFGTQSMTGG